jgi:hypothetical protein
MKSNLFNFTISFAIFFGLSLNYVFAQYPGMGSFRNQQSQNFINRQTTNNLALLNQSRYIGNQELTYHVQQKDSVFKDFSSFMYYDTITHKSFLIFENKNFPKSDTVHRFEKIYSNNILKISLPYVFNINGKDTEGILDGSPNDTCWVFKVMRGSLRVYAKTTDFIEYDNELYFTNAEIIPSAIVAIQLNNGPLLQYNVENLKNIFQSDPSAIRLLQKKKFLKAIRKYNSNQIK